MKHRSSSIAASSIIVLGAAALISWYVWLREPTGTTGLIINQTATTVVPEKVRVAFIGDQGNGTDSRAVLELIKSERTDLVLHQGDFDYYNDPDAWDGLISEVLGADFPYFATIGNHDVLAWAGYQRKLIDRIARVPAVTCAGDIGINASCTYGPLFFALSGIGTMGKDHVPYLETSLDSSDASWKICSWHKNQHLFQTGGKDDEVGWAVYETCREAGALIVTGHEHSYSRTHLMSSFNPQVVASTESTLTLSPGQTVAVVSGLGGHSIRPANDELAANLWWAALSNADTGGTAGALFCDFNDTPHHASCFFKNIAGQIPDQFQLISSL